MQALARRPEAVPARERLELHRVDVLEPAPLSEPLAGSDIVFSCVDTPSGCPEYCAS
ncbi:MAG: hypothetical protein KTR31_37040 [Myxococcales bacterium]|nr:hypothetical protein [Myxococcales bacterium]